MAPKYGGFFATYSSNVSNPSTPSPNCSRRSHTRSETIVAPYDIARTSIPFALVSVKSSTEAPSAVRPKGLRFTDGLFVGDVVGASLGLRSGRPPHAGMANPQLPACTDSVTRPVANA